MNAEPEQSTTPTKNNLFCSIGSHTTSISDDELRNQVESFLESLGERDDVLILPPDFTRFHSHSGVITQYISEYYNFTPKEKKNDCTSSKTSSNSPGIKIIPALGTHAPMTKPQIETMFGPNLANKSPDPFIVHNWREDVVTIGHAPASMVRDATYGMVNEPWPAQLNKLVWEKRITNHPSANTDTDTPKKPRPLVISVGQVVPHEVLGMANFNKNLFVGVGGVEAINLSHFIGAVYGMEKLMGRGQNPLRAILNHASKEFLEGQLDLWYILTGKFVDCIRLKNTQHHSKQNK